jgi:hypothetical protein
MASIVALDHVIILVPYATLSNPPPWITKHFTLTPGGRHADGKTENKLICFQDGSYIELIAFINDDTKNREDHWWGKKPYGIIDFAFTTADSAEQNFKDIQGRLEDNEGAIRYKEPREGGRMREDGQELKWKVTFPETTGHYQRGELPFFCHDVTDRSLRVPIQLETTKHPSGAYGIKKMTICITETDVTPKVRALVSAYKALLDAPDVSQDPDVGVFTVNRLHSVKGAEDIQLFVYALPKGNDEPTDEGTPWLDVVVGGFGEKLDYHELPMAEGYDTRSKLFLDVDLLAE